MGRLPFLVMGLALSLLIVLGTAALSAWPAWQSLPEDQALLRVSFTASGARRCRPRTSEELAALPRNMRQVEVCERRRAPVQIELELNGQVLLSEILWPSGLAGSGPSRIYRRFELPADDYDIQLRLRTDPETAEFASTARRKISLRPGESVAIDYDGETREFIFDVPKEGG